MGWVVALAEAVRTGRAAVLVTVVGGPDVGHHAVVAADGTVMAAEFAFGGPLPEAAARALDAGTPRTVAVGEGRYYMEPFRPPPELVVVGAGHVAQPVAHLGRLLGYTVTVIDDRPEYAHEARFPDAHRVICADFVAAVRSLKAGPRHHVVLVTRGHRHDMDCLRELMERPVAYIGMIGSRIRVATVFRLLQEEYGVDFRHFDKVYAPIGLDVGARSPAEIAVAVAAELLKVRSGGTGESLSRLGRAMIHGR